MKLCVIGAGAAGLCAIKHGIDFGCDVTAFEQTRCIGGTWVFTEDVGKDRNGLDVHSSMYEGLRTNLPKEVMNYPSVEFPEESSSFIPAKEVVQYMEGYADKYDLRKHIKFEHHHQHCDIDIMSVLRLRVRPLENEKWELIVQDFAEKNVKVLKFDAVLVCNGHYSSPNIPKIEGQELFEGVQIHSHDYRKPERFIGQSVLVIGCGPSGYDCVESISKCAKNLSWSHHSKDPLLLRLPVNVDEKPDVKEILRNSVVFSDDTVGTYTAIIYCTGYNCSFPFISAECELKISDNFIRPLFKHCLSINKPSLGFIGVPYLVFPKQTFDLQVRFCLTFITGRKALPSREEMLKDYKSDREYRKLRGFSKSEAHVMGPNLDSKYYAELAETASIEPMKPVLLSIFKCAITHKLENYEVYRDYTYKIIDDEKFEFSLKEAST